MKQKIRIQICHVVLISIVLLLNPVNLISQDLPKNETKAKDAIINEIVNDFLKAVNSGDRKSMQDFLFKHYDQNVLKRIPLFAVVSLNMAFYYESGGVGYDLIQIDPVEGNLISIELNNKLTDNQLKFTVPTSGAPQYKINQFIKSELIPSSNKDKSEKQLNDNEIIARLGKAIKKLQEDEEFSGAIIVAKDGQILLKEALGMASKSYESSNRTDTKFNIASVGKMFTGLAITQLVEQGKLSFDDPISKYVSSEWLNPEISSKIQVKHLLTHTSGLGDYFRDAYAQCKIPFFRDLEDYKSLVVDDNLNFEPGARFSYSNTGMLLLGVVIENVTNVKYFNYLKKNLFEPVGMFNTDGYDKDYPVINRATGYTKVYENGEVKWNNHQFTRIMRGSPSGGIYSTVEDLMIFDEAIRTNMLLSAEYTDILIKGRPELNVSFHGYGFFNAEGVAGRELSHKGDGQGMNCHFKMFLDSGYTYIVLSNYSPPSANIVAKIIDQLISHNVATSSD